MLATFSIISLLKYEHMLIIESEPGTRSTHAAALNPIKK